MILLRLFYHSLQMISLVFRLLLNPRVPLRTKLIPALAIGYVVLPFDLLPDFIPILGGVDDAILAIVAAYAFVLLGTRYLAAAKAGQRRRKGGNAEDRVVDATYHFIEEE